MTKTNKIILGISLGAIALVGGYFVVKALVKPKKDREGGDDYQRPEVKEGGEVAKKSKGVGARTLPPVGSASFPLKRGDRNEAVKVLQEYINRSPVCRDKIKSQLPLEEDGIFGKNTETAYNNCYGEKTIDQKTWGAMANALPNMV